MSPELLIDLDKILSLSKVYIYWLDKNNIYQGCNETQAKLFGLSSRFDIIGKKNCDLFKDYETVKFINNINLEVLTTGGSRIVEESLELNDGSKLIFLSNKTALLGKNGEIVGLFGISFDITNQKLKENRLSAINRETAFTLDYILAHIPAHIYWKNREGIYLGSNDGQAKSLGLNYGYELVGKTDFNLPGSKDNAIIFRNNDLEVMSSGITKTIEESAIFDGKPAKVLSKKVPLLNSFGETTGVLGISIDITDRKKAEKLYIKNEISEKTAEFAKKLSGVIAHELRNPLAVINIQMDLLNSELLSNNSQKTKDSFYKQIIKNVKNKIYSANYIITEMLAKIRFFASGSISPTSNFKKTAIADNIDDFLANYPFNQKERKLVSFKNVKSDDFIYLGDSILTTHIFSNLMQNSLRAIKEAGKGTITIELKSSKTNTDSKFNQVIFKDTATGIPKKHIKNIFDQYKSNNGTGLGLSFSKMIMKSYNGDIICYSEEGVYTEFVLEFPRVKN